MKYVCDNCGAVIEEEEMRSRTSFIGYSGSCPCYENQTYECSCGGTYVEGRQCGICGEWHTEEDLNGGVCIECLKSCATPENAALFGMTAPDPAEGLLSLFAEEELIRILVEEKRKVMNGGDGIAKEGMKKRAYLYLMRDCDRDEFGEFLARKEERRQ